VLVDGHAITLGIEGVVKLAAGSHVVEASAPDHVADKRTLTVVAGTPQTVALTLAPVPRTGHARVQATQLGARVTIDGKDVGPAPVEAELLAGGHTVDVTAPGFAPDRLELVVAVGQSRTVTVTLEPPRAPASTTTGPAIFHRWWFWAAVGGVAAATAATIVLWPAKTESPLTGSLGTASSDFK
ncbi:MAG TPA: PEGA domain-containing protein, partial [Polyangia bacterium]|nr:PEGA domain-containing protein [Polyangia bacterium]